MILVDTSILSLAFRRRAREVPEAAEARVLRALVEGDDDVRVPGIVFQELLSGVRTGKEHQALRAALEGFPLVLATREDHEAASVLANGCRAAGIAAATVDCLIAAQAMRRAASLFTTDADFEKMRRVADLRLYRDAPR